MRILVYSPFYPPHVGGLESHADEFNRALGEAGTEIIVFTPRLPQTAAIEETRHQNVRVIRFPAVEIIHNYPFPAFWKGAFLTQYRRLWREDFDLVIGRTRFFFTSLMALLHARIQHKPYVHIEHGSDYVRFNSQWKTRFGRWYDDTLGRLVITCADRVIANSEASKRFAEKLGRRHDVRTVYRGVDLQAIRDTTVITTYREHFPGKKLIAFVGRLIDGKRVDELIQALSNLTRQDFALLIIGDGPERSTLEKLVNKDQSLRERVLFLGVRPFVETIGILKSIDLFVNPSHAEGIPTSVLEAALCGKAIVATNVGGTPEIVTDEKSAFLVPAGNVLLLQEKIEHFLDDTNLRERFGKAAAQAVANKFDWDQSGKKYLMLFQELLPSRHP